MVSDNETWIIEIGDEVLQKQAAEGDNALSELERAVYCFWVIDYAVRNSGTLYPMEDIHPGAAEELKGIAETHGWTAMASLLAHADVESETFENEFYTGFEAACEELKAAYGGAD